MNTDNLSAAVEGFLSALVGDVSPATATWYAASLRPFVKFVGDDLLLSELTPAVVRRYKADLINSGRSLYTVQGRQRAIRRFGAWAVEEGLLGRNVALDVPLVRLPQMPPKAVTEDDLTRLLTHLPQESIRDRAIVFFLIDTGCRVGGLCSLTPGGVDVPDRCAIVTEKGNRSRRVYFTDPTADALALWLAVRPATDCDALFLSERGGALTTNGVRLLLERIGKRAGVKGRINPHAFRHSFARAFLRNGGNLATLGQIMGHTPGSPVTARHYGVFADRELQEMHGRFSPLAVRR